MKLNRIEIANYRNLDGVKLSFDPLVNFIVGETNLGKSNFLFLINTIFNRRNFSETDFVDPEKPIEIRLKLSLHDMEKGLFEDLFDPKNSDLISITTIQESIDDNIRFFHTESESPIPQSSIKSLNFIYYDSLRNPGNELTFDKNKGAGKFLNHVFKKYLEKHDINDLDFIDKTKLGELLEFINITLGKIKSFQDFSIRANTEDDIQNLLARIVTLKDGQNFNLHNSGYGVQYLTLICLTIFDKLITADKFKTDRNFFEDEEGNRYTSLLLGLDEPEIHLHPYMQRSLIKYLMKIIENKDADFHELIFEIFSIYGLLGQIIICTHSPSILLSSYKQIIRFYRNNQDNQILVKNGQEIDLLNEEKHLDKNMPYIKEAFFSKRVILVEGDTEIGAFLVFAEKMVIDLDDSGISIIRAGSADSIPPLMNLLDKFGIANLGFMDRDKYQKYKDTQNLYFTDKRDFEEDVVHSCFENKKEDILINILEKNDREGKNRIIEKNKINSIIKKYQLDLDEVNCNHNFETADPKLLYALFLAWLDINKSIILGRVIGESLPKEFIPEAFKNFFNLTKSLIHV